MRHETAARRGAEGWHYVSLSRRGGYPLGYCAEHEPHETETQARECFSRWRRDNLDMRDEALEWTTCGIQGCRQPAKACAEVRGDYGLISLCAEHFTRDAAVAGLGLDGPAGDRWCS